ncbi:hypothetical protein [Nocardioides daejeonensis]|uniref:hypothetical protein n=1 Tax=Nocardioides daejeonensis TaxID=1046556 RepID=UPI001EF3F2E8|nr:hypothetical protein [Nocardioides daejeonensis]
MKARQASATATPISSSDQEALAEEELDDVLEEALLEVVDELEELDAFEFDEEESADELAAGTDEEEPDRESVR